MGRITRKIKQVLFSSNRLYLKYLKDPVCENYVLLEAGQGKNIMGNMFALLKEIETNEEWNELKPFFVVTPETQNKAQKLFKSYGFNRVQLLIRDSKEYLNKLATSKYLITDNSFPTYFIKRESQIYLNTWHGTPIKHLGRSDLRNATSIPNIQKNYLSCDYALFPNEHTKDVFMKDYMLDKMFQRNILMADYPRNDAFNDNVKRDQLRKKYSLNEKTVIAYMPTWRGTGRKADSEEQIKVIEEYLDKIDAKLDDTQIMYVNLHFLVTQSLNFSNYKHIKRFPKNIETYEFLNACDVLITDYSSVLFDFANTGRKIILFAYDKDSYLQKKGTYMDITDFPFPVVEDVDSLIQEINREDTCPYKEFKDIYCKYCGKNTSNKILKLLVDGDSQDLEISKLEDDHRKKIVCHVGWMRSKVYMTVLLEKLKQLDYNKNDIILVIENGVTNHNFRLIEKLPEEVYFYAVVKSDLKGLWETVFKYFYVRWNLFDKQLKAYFQREKDRLFPNWHVDEIKMLFFHNPKYIYIYDQFQIPKEYHQFPYNIIGLMTFNKWFVRAENYMENHYDRIVRYDDDFMKDDIRSFKTRRGDAKAVIKSLHTKKKGDELRVKIRILLYSRRLIDVQNLKLSIGNDVYLPLIKGRYTNKENYYVWRGTVKFAVLYKDIKDQESQNRVFIIEPISETETAEIRFRYGNLMRRVNRFRSYKPYTDDRTNLTMFFRYPKTGLILTIRDRNITDSRIERVKVVLAFVCSKILFCWKPILLFEKNAARYEESASVVYERLIDDGYKNAYFVLDKNYEFREQIGVKYQKNVINKCSFKHYLCFFSAVTLIGSEAKAHAFELRPISRLVARKLNHSPYNYVFLQHGVMYMISLNSSRREMFKSKEQIKGIKERTVVSSELEAEHFQKYGKRRRESLYICGLPKYDRNKWNDTADKIVVMITWRPWEYGQSLEDIQKTTYFQMLKSIVSHIPEEYYDKLLVLPHPLVEKQMKSNQNLLSSYIPMSAKYDTILQDTKLLITDYSSISYDAFYRGANIIFCWEEKDEVMSQYGKNAKLMLTPELAFGDLNYDYNELSTLVEQAYHSGQNEQYVKNYRKIVTYHDGHNTDRLIQMMKEDEIL